MLLQITDLVDILLTWTNPNLSKDMQLHAQ